MNEHERLLMHFAKTVDLMRRAQRGCEETDDDMAHHIRRALEKEVDALVALHLTPSALKGDKP